MTDLSEKILDSYQTRNTKKQKDAFISLMKERYPDLKTEERRELGLLSRNLILGDPETADAVLSAHYDTCAVLPVPNLLFVNNIFSTILVYIPLVIVIWAVSALFTFIMIRFDLPGTLFPLFTLLLMGLLVWATMFGKPSTHTANDNTSGVITLIETYEKMPEEMRNRTALVFFDNEELGLIGSRAFKKLHKAKMKTIPLINFDCVSDGDTVMFMLDRNTGYLKEDLDRLFSAEGKQLLIRSSTNTMYPSDQNGYSRAVAVCSLHHCFLGWYIPRIHTKNDIIFDRSNIELLSDGNIKLLERIFLSGENT